MVFGTANAKSLVFYTMKGSVAADNSILAYPQGIAMIVVPENYTIFVTYKKMEYYAGAWDSPLTKNGVGVVFKNVDGKLYADMPAISGAYSKPLESITVADLSGAINYMKSELALTTPSYLSEYHIMYKVEGEAAFTSMATRKWQDGVSLPTSNTAAKSRLPSEVWKAQSVSSAY